MNLSLENTAIVLDSTSDYPDAPARFPNMRFVPLYVRFGDETYKDYVRGMLRHPQFVGCHWFKYRDEATTGRPLDAENYQIGFVDICDTPYPETIAACREVGYGMYEYRTGN